jgi:hypothetical protein
VRRVTGRQDYKFGDLSKEALRQLTGKVLYSLLELNMLFDRVTGKVHACMHVQHDFNISLGFRV